MFDVLFADVELFPPVFFKFCGVVVFYVDVSLDSVVC